MPATLFLSGVAASFGAHPLFSHLDAVAAPGHVIALAGPNGAGKTTLLRIVAGELPPDTGTIRTAPDAATVGYLPQTAPRASESIGDYARRRTGVAAAQEAYEAAAEALASGRPGADDRYAHALETWLALGGADLETRLAETLARVGLPVEPDRPLGSLSGGQAARASLASVLVSRFDVLLLDEPTNNLDADGLALMTEFVRECGAAVLLASHDRAFCDAVATSVLEIDPVQQTVATYAGGWTDYRAAKAVARGQADAAHAAYVERRDALEAGARRQTEWARHGRAKADKVVKERGTPRIDRKPMEDRARRMDQRAARARDAAARLEVVEQARKEWELRYAIAEAEPSAEVVLTLDAVVAQAGGFRVGPLTATVARGDRVALAGANGSGKTTLLEVLLGRREPASGRATWGTRTHVGVLDQDRTFVSGPATLLDTVAGLLDVADLAEVRTLLAKFGLGADHVGRPCDTLSPGERTRAALAVLQGRAVNVLVLDEPTNHADVEAIEQLEAALGDFSGTILLVTHDAHLADAVGATTRWTCVRTGDAARVDVAPPA